MTTYILYNPYARNGKGEEGAKELKARLKDEGACLYDLTRIESYATFFSGLAEEDKVILCGGDGTINRFANEALEAVGDREIFYCPAGSGNDFWHDLSEVGEEPILLNPYLNNLPRVSVNGTESAFLNGVGYGIDGYCF